MNRKHWRFADWILTTFGIPILMIGVLFMTKTDAGRDLMWRQGIGDASGTTGTSTGTAATTMTDSGASWGTTQYVGRMVVCGNRYANIISHTATVLTIDRWYDIASPGGAAGSTPGATTVYIIMNTAPPAQFMGLTADATAVGTGDTTLPSEITTVGGGLIRKQGTLAHTAGASTGTVVGVFTANGTDSLPVTVAKMGIGPSLLSTVKNLFQTLLNATATITASGDQVTVTDTVTA